MSGPCPVCEGDSTRVFLRRPDVPVYCNRRHESAASAREVARGDLELALCEDCGMVFNAAFDPSRVEYSKEYENAQHFSPRFQEYLAGLTADLAARHALAGRTVVEIGCGDGHFLAQLCAAADCDGVGFDPASPETAPSPRVRLVRELYGARHAHQTAHLLCCRHMLEHVHRPRELLAGVRVPLAAQDPPAAVYFEVPDALFTLRDLGIWDLLYEHCLYFTAPALRHLFVSSGYEVTDLLRVFEGQFLALHGRPRAGAAGAGAPAGAGPARSDSATTVAERPELGSLADRFGAAYRRKLEHWSRCLADAHRQGRPVAVWGAGTKGAMFLNSVEGGASVQHVIDVNPRKHGGFVPGTGQEVTAPDSLPRDTEVEVLVMNPAYAGEIRAHLEQLGVRARMQVV